MSGVSCLVCTDLPPPSKKALGTDQHHMTSKRLSKTASSKATAAAAPQAEKGAVSESLTLPPIQITLYDGGSMRGALDDMAREVRVTRFVKSRGGS